MTALVDRVDYIVTQYIWALENDSEVVPRLQEYIRQGHFKDFSVRVSNAIAPIRRFNEHAGMPDPLDTWEINYINVEIWFRLGGYGADLTTTQGKERWRNAMINLEATGFKYTDKGLRFVGSPKNPCAEILISQPQPCVLAEPEKEIPVSNKIIIKNVTFINNVDVTSLNDDQLIDAIKTIESEIADLKSVKTKSAKIAAKILEAQGTLTTIVELLDGRA